MTQSDETRAAGFWWARARTHPSPWVVVEVRLADLGGRRVPLVYVSGQEDFSSEDRFVFGPRCPEPGAEPVSGHPKEEPGTGDEARSSGYAEWDYSRRGLL